MHKQGLFVSLCMCMYGRMDGWMDRWMDHGRTDGWMDEDGWMHGWMDGWMGARECGREQLVDIHCHTYTHIHTHSHTLTHTFKINGQTITSTHSYFVHLYQVSLEETEKPMCVCMSVYRCMCCIWVSAFVRISHYEHAYYSTSIIYTHSHTYTHTHTHTHRHTHTYIHIHTPPPNLKVTHSILVNSSFAFGTFSFCH